MGSKRWGSLIVVATVAIACGSRTGLLYDDVVDGGPDATTDASLDVADAHDAGDADAADADADVVILAKCVPRSCQDQGFECGFNGDGCGNAIDCGTCPAPQVCGAQSYSKCAVGPPCKPKTCSVLWVTPGA